jgi:hypothetical protein
MDAYCFRVCLVSSLLVGTGSAIAQQSGGNEAEEVAHVAQEWIGASEKGVSVFGDVAVMQGVNQYRKTQLSPPIAVAFTNVSPSEWALAGRAFSCQPARLPIEWDALAFGSSHR